MQIFYHNVTGIHYAVIAGAAYLLRSMRPARVKPEVIERNEFGFFERVL